MAGVEAAVAGDADACIEQAHAALDAGDSRRARALALSVLRAAEAAHDLHLEARALACLAYGDRLVSRIRRAHDTSRRAAQLFQQVGDMAGEAIALGTVSHSASSLGRNEEAVEAALLGVQLGELLPSGRQQVLAYNYLGVAYFWSKSFDRGAAAFETSARLALHCQPAISPVQPRLNHVWCEAVNIVMQRCATGRMPPLDRLLDAMRLCDDLIGAGRLDGILPGFIVTTQAVWRLTSGLRHCWSGDLEAARACQHEARAWIEKYGTVTWLAALHAWLCTEIAWADGDWTAAERGAAAMIRQATQVEHEQLACLGHVLASQILESQGRFSLALDEVRRMKRREQMIRSEMLESRARVVKWQLDVRQGEQHVQQLQIESRHFERLSLEDPLTGLPNRRCFEQRLAEALAALASDGPAVSVLLIDVDRFKQINDGHSHRVGDQVLCSLAGILRSQVRELDLPARLAGDEFVILLAHADASAAQTACLRLAEVVRVFHWHVLAPGLQVTLSIGCATARPGDSCEDLLAGADAAMYAVKRQGADSKRRDPQVP